VFINDTINISSDQFIRLISERGLAAAGISSFVLFFATDFEAPIHGIRAIEYLLGVISEREGWLGS
jgi:hypothetical protein